MRLQIPPPSPAPPQRSTVEFFSFRQSFIDSRSSSPNSLISLELTPTKSRTPKAPSTVATQNRDPDQDRGREDPVALLQRECSALRLRLATASRERERAALTRKRPESISTASSKTVVASDAGIRAPPSSARTPPSATLGIPSELRSTPSTGYNTASEYFSTVTTTTTRKDTGETVTFTRTQVTQVRPPAPDALSQQSQKQKYERWLPPAPAQTEEQAQLTRRQSQRQQVPKRGQHQPPPHQNQPHQQQQQQPHQQPVQLAHPLPQRPPNSRSPIRRHPDNNQAHESHGRKGHRKAPAHHANRKSFASTTSASVPSPDTALHPLPVPAPGMPGYDSPPPKRMKPAEMCKQLERSLREVQELLRARDKEVEVLKRERDRLLADREREKDRRMDAERKAEAHEREVDAVRRELDNVKRERDRMLNERDREREREREREKQRERERQTRERSNFRRSRSQAPSSFYSSLTTETETIAHANSLDVFLTKTDSWSGAQVIQAVEDLNAEISHFAATATETCTFLARGASPPARRRSRGAQPPPGPQATMPLEEALEIAPWLSPSFVKILTTHEHSTDPLLVQLALQASVATCCARSLSLFCVGFPAKLDGLLGKVYGQMAATEPQPTSSRWRALTHRSIRTLYPGLEEYAVSELITTMLRWSAAVFDVSGCSSKDKSDSSNSTLRSQLRRIAEAAYKLSLVTREDILSTNFEAVIVESGVAFDSANMCNAFADGYDGAGGKAGERVLCTTELGLKCITRRGKNYLEGTEADAFERRLLLQPKVVLEEAVDAIIG